MNYLSNPQNFFLLRSSSSSSRVAIIPDPYATGPKAEPPCLEPDLDHPTTNRARRRWNSHHQTGRTYENNSWDKELQGRKMEPAISYPCSPLFIARRAGWDNPCFRSWQNGLRFAPLQTRQIR